MKISILIQTSRQKSNDAFPCLFYAYGGHVYDGHFCAAALDCAALDAISERSFRIVRRRGCYAVFRGA